MNTQLNDEVAGFLSWDAEVMCEAQANPPTAARVAGHLRKELQEWASVTEHNADEVAILYLNETEVTFVLNGNMIHGFEEFIAERYPHVIYKQTVATEGESERAVVVVFDVLEHAEVYDGPDSARNYAFVNVREAHRSGVVTLWAWSAKRPKNCSKGQVYKLGDATYPYGTGVAADADTVSPSIASMYEASGLLLRLPEVVATL